ncbi:Uncharacterized protein cmbei_8005380 [Cryptosporidium meleagridis]
MCTKKYLLVFLIALNVFFQLSESGERLDKLSGFSIIGLRSNNGCGLRKLLCLGRDKYGEGRLHPTLGPTNDGLRISAPKMPTTRSTTRPPSPFPPPSPPPSPPPPPLPPKARKNGSLGASNPKNNPFLLSLPGEETTPGSSSGLHNGDGFKQGFDTSASLGARQRSSASSSSQRAPSFYDNVQTSDGDSMETAPEKPPLPENWRSILSSGTHHHHHHQHQHHHQHHHHHHQRKGDESSVETPLKNPTYQKVLD